MESLNTRGKVLRKSSEVSTAHSAPVSADPERNPVHPALTTGLNVCNSPLDLNYDSVISGSFKSAKVRLTTSQAMSIVVIAKAKSVTMVASTALYNTPEAPFLFALIRQQLTSYDYDMPTVLWAVPSLVADLNDLRSNGLPTIADTERMNAKNTAHWKRFIEWVKYGIQVGASDIHVEVDGAHARIRFRVDGIMVPMQNGSNGDVLAQPARESIALAFNSISDRGTATGSNFNSSEFLENIVSVDIDTHSVKLRCDSIPTQDGFHFIARFSRASQSYTYASYGYLPWHQQTIKRAIASRRGMIVLAGIPGSGKTSAVQLMLEDLARNDQLKIATIDTPVEKKLAGIGQTLLPMDESDPDQSALLFNKAIQHWLRGNPDVMSLGEIRSTASGKAAVMLAEIGCLLFGTVHAHNCLGIIQRLISIGVDLYALTAPGIMNLLIHQTLVPMLCPACKIPLSMMPETEQNAMRTMGRRLDVCLENLHYQAHNRACPTCMGKGIQGRTVVCEMITHDEQLIGFILKRDLYGASQYWQNKADGRYDTLNFIGKSSFYHAFVLAQRGIISIEEVGKFGFPEDYPEPRSRADVHLTRSHAR